MKTTIYDLLGMIKDGKAPKKIKDRLNMIYTFSASTNDYVGDEAGKLFFYNLMHFRDKCLNDEVEIIEEKKGIPEKLDEKEIEITMSIGEQICANKINEILDYLESKDE